jgi:glycosyltransferase involved in cell wall biosynthesis
MNVLMLCEFYSAEVEFQENLLVKYYGKHGHKVTVVTSTFETVFEYYNDQYDDTRPGRTFYDHGAKIIKLPYRYNILNRLRAYTRIDKILADEAPDLIYVHDIMPNLPEAIAYLRAHPNCRMILDYHADYSNSGRNQMSLKILHGVLRKWFLDRARPHLSRIFPVVPASATFLHEVYKVPYSEMEVLPLGADVDLAMQIKAQNARADLRRSLGIGENEIVVFTGGKLTPNRQTELLFDAVARLPQFPLRIVVVGDSGNEHRSYQEFLKKLAEGRNDIHFAGWLGRHDIYRHMDMADIAVFPASQSIMWQQAISMGLPLIVGDTGSQDISYLNLEDNIIILRGNDIRADRLAQAIESVVGNPVRLAQMASGARKVAAEYLDWNKLIERTLRFNDRSQSHLVVSEQRP